jgi:hypothetical protein
VPEDVCEVVWDDVSDVEADVVAVELKLLL